MRGWEAERQKPGDREARRQTGVQARRLGGGEVGMLRCREAERPGDKETVKPRLEDREAEAGRLGDREAGRPGDRELGRSRGRSRETERLGGREIER